MKFCGRMSGDTGRESPCSIRCGRRTSTRQNGAQEVTGPFGIDNKVKDIMTDDATTRTLLDILEECRGMRQQKGALYMISKI